jgi:hypothetical protein
MNKLEELRMNTGKAGAFFLILFLAGAVFSAAAQEEGDDDDEGELPIASDWSVLNFSGYARGDQIFSPSLGVLFPVLFYNSDGPLSPATGNVKIGGTGNLSYTYFFGPRLFVGGELGVMFSSTLSKETLCILAIGAKAGYQFVIGRFEFPLSLMVGIAPQKYLDFGYFGLILKPQGSVFWRFNAGWSFGLNAAYWWVPQWPKDSDPKKAVTGSFTEISLSVRYHF